MSEAALSTPAIHTGLSSSELIDMALARDEGVLSDTGIARGDRSANWTLSRRPFRRARAVE